MPFKYPIALELEGRLCIVVGGGELAEHKCGSLIEAGARVKVVSESFTLGLEELARRGSVELIRKSYSDGDLEGAFLAVAATDDASTNAQIFEEAEQRRVLLNAVDDVEHCHFAVPSIIRHGDFIIAISTGGKAPALAKRLRIELSEQFGAEYGVLVDLLAEERSKALPDRKVPFEEWALRWQRALGSEGGDLIGLVRLGRIEEARQIVAETLSTGAAPPAPQLLVELQSQSPSGREGDRPGGQLLDSSSLPPVSIVGAGPGDPGLITVRGRELVEDADVVVYDRLVHPSLVEGKVAIYAGKEPGKHSLTQPKINELLVDLARAGKRVVRLKGGDPFVFGRGAEEAEALAEAGVPFEVVPAPSSAIAVPAYAGIPVTDRRYASSVSILTARTASRDVDWGPFIDSGGTLVILMGAEMVEEISRDLVAAGLDPSTPAAIIENGTLPEQRVITGRVSGLADAAKRECVRAPSTIVVGDVVRLRERIEWFKAETAGFDAQVVS